MLTIFGVPKKSSPKIDRIQKNAVGSWKFITDKVVLFGKDGYNLSYVYDTVYVPSVNVNEFGTPLLNSVFDLACGIVNAKYLMYTNCDMVYVDPINEIVEEISHKYKEFLMVGRRWDVPDLHIRFNGPRVDKDDVLTQVNKTGKLHIWSGIDYFVFPKEVGIKLEMPSFAVGRVGFDNWIIGKVKQLGITVIDATSRITAIHQDHDYEHVTGGRDWTRTGPEAVENLRLVNGVPLLTIRDADVKL
jgi:hypothetical protein